MISGLVCRNCQEPAHGFHLVPLGGCAAASSAGPHLGPLRATWRRLRSRGLRSLRAKGGVVRAGMGYDTSRGPFWQRCPLILRHTNFRYGHLNLVEELLDLELKEASTQTNTRAAFLFRLLETSKARVSFPFFPVEQPEQILSSPDREQLLSGNGSPQVAQPLLCAIQREVGCFPFSFSPLPPLPPTPRPQPHVLVGRIQAPGADDPHQPRRSGEGLLPQRRGHAEVGRPGARDGDVASRPLSAERSVAFEARG